MNFEVVPSADTSFLRVTTKVEYSLDDMLLLINRIKSEADHAKQDRVLIDCRDFSGYMSEAERFLGGKHLAEVFGFRLRAALLLPAEQITKLGEMTAVNRGAKLLVTHDEAEAMAYLMSEV